MAEEVNKIIYNTLASGRNLYLTGIGSLVIERFGAQRHTRKFVEQPRKTIVFTERQNGVSLEEEIARIGNVNAEKAHVIFEQWLMQALDGDTLNIGEVGTLRRDKFTVADAFADILNRQGRERIAIKTRSNASLYIFASLCCLFALCIAGYVWFENDGKAISLPFIGGGAERGVESTGEQLAEAAAENKTDDAAINTGTLASAAAVGTDAGTPSRAASEISPEGKRPEAEPAAATTARTSADIQKSAEMRETADTVFESESGRSYAVLGIYSTPENAFRAVGQAKKRMPEANCTVYRYGARYMVSIYDSDNREQAVRYMDSISHAFKDLWVYTKK